jgi:hypothetical protein
MARKLGNFMTEKRSSVMSKLGTGGATLACAATAILSMTTNAWAQTAPAQPPVVSAAPADSPDAPPAPGAMPGDTSATSAAMSMPEPAAAPPPEEPIVPPEPATDSSGFKLNVGGGMILFFQQPLASPGGTTHKNFFEVFETKLRLDAEFGAFGVHLLPVIRDTKERGFFAGTSWVQEAYAFGKAGPVTVKVGKVFAQFGRFWDNSFYGNVQEYDGFKLDPNHGISVEGSLSPDQRMGMQFFAQYFVTDGTANYSLPGRDTMSTVDAMGNVIAGARRRNYLVGRVEPFVKVGDITTLKLGLSGGYFQADIPTLANKQDVGRVAVDGTVMVQNLTVWGEYTKQLGQHVATGPGPGPASKHNDYAMVGGEYTYDRLTFRYNFNMGSYTDAMYKETRHVPGIGVVIDKDHLFALFEYALAQSHTAAGTQLIDSSVNVTIHGKI